MLLLTPRITASVTCSWLSPCLVEYWGAKRISAKSMPSAAMSSPSSKATRSRASSVCRQVMDTAKRERYSPRLPQGTGACICVRSSSTDLTGRAMPCSLASSHTVSGRRDPSKCT